MEAGKNRREKKKALQRVSSEEYDQIYHRIKRLVMAAAKKAAGDNKRIDIEDLAQPTFLRIRRAAELYRPEEGPFEAYILPLIGNSVRWEARKERAAMKGKKSFNACRIGGEKNLLFAFSVNPRALDPAEEADKKSKTEELKKAIAKAEFNPTERKVIELFLDGLKFAEIARQINKERMTVTYSFRTAVAKIIKIIMLERLKARYA